MKKRIEESRKEDIQRKSWLGQGYRVVEENKEERIEKTEEEEG